MPFFIFKPKIRGLYTRAVSNQERVIMARVRYFIYNFVVLVYVWFAFLIATFLTQNQICSESTANFYHIKYIVKFKSLYIYVCLYCELYLFKNKSNVYSFLLSECPVSPEILGNGFCNDEANIAACSFDGDDCCKICINSEFCTECLCYDDTG